MSCAIDLFLPIGSVSESLRKLEVEDALLIHVVDEIDILFGVERVLVVAHPIEGVMGVQRHTSYSGLTLLCVDDDDTIGST